MSSHTRVPAYLVAAIALAMLGGCTADGEPAPPSPTPAATAQPAQSRLVVVRQPEGFIRAAHDPAAPGWQRLLVQDDEECAVDARGESHRTDLDVRDPRATSLELLERLAADDGTAPGPVEDVVIPVEAPSGSGPSRSVAFVEAGWTTDDSTPIAVRAAVRAVPVVAYTGEQTVGSLELRVACRTDPLPDDLWDALVAGLRADVIGEVRDDGGWG